MTALGPMVFGMLLGVAFGVIIGISVSCATAIIIAFVVFSGALLITFVIDWAGDAAIRSLTKRFSSTEEKSPLDAKQPDRTGS